MDGEADPMAQPMTEIVSIALIFNMIPCHSVYLADGNARSNGLYCQVVGLFDDLIDP